MNSLRSTAIAALALWTAIGFSGAQAAPTETFFVSTSDPGAAGITLSSGESYFSQIDFASLLPFGGSWTSGRLHIDLLDDVDAPGRISNVSILPGSLQSESNFVTVEEFDGFNTRTRTFSDRVFEGSTERVQITHEIEQAQISIFRGPVPASSLLVDSQGATSGETVIQVEDVDFVQSVNVDNQFRTSRTTFDSVRTVDTHHITQRRTDEVLREGPFGTVFDMPGSLLDFLDRRAGALFFQIRQTTGDFIVESVTLELTGQRPVPTPATAGLLFAGLGLVILFRRRQKV